MAMVIAALCAEGTSTIGDAYQIDKGYERIDERLRALGAHIERVEVLSMTDARRAVPASRSPREGSANVATGLPVLDHLVGELARDGALQARARGRARTARTRRSPPPARALGGALARALLDGAARSRLGARAGGEALASAALERATRAAARHERRLLRPARRRRSSTDVASRFLRELADAAGINLHVRCSRAPTRSTCSRRSSRRSAPRSARPAVPHHVDRGGQS